MFDQLFPTPAGQKYIEALGEFPHPDHLGSKDQMRVIVEKIMWVMESQELALVTQEEMARLCNECSSWGYGPVYYGSHDEVAAALADAIWSTGARRIKGAPFGPFGEPSVAKANASGLGMRCQFLTADNQGQPMTFSHVIARKDKASWWYAGHAIRSEPLVEPVNSIQAEAAKPDFEPKTPAEEATAFEIKKLRTKYLDADSMLRWVTGTEQILAVFPCPSRGPSRKFTWPKWIGNTCSILFLAALPGLFQILYQGLPNDVKVEPTLLQQITIYILGALMVALALWLIIGYAYGIACIVLAIVFSPLWVPVSLVSWFRGNRKGVDVALLTDKRVWTVKDITYNQKTDILEGHLISLPFDSVLSCTLGAGLLGKEIQILAVDQFELVLSMDPNELAGTVNSGHYKDRVVSFKDFVKHFKEVMPGKCKDGIGQPVAAQKTLQAAPHGGPGEP